MSKTFRRSKLDYDNNIENRKNKFQSRRSKRRKVFVERYQVEDKFVVTNDDESDNKIKEYT